MVISKYPTNTSIKVLSTLMGFQLSEITKCRPQTIKRSASLHISKPTITKLWGLGQQGKIRDSSRYTSATSQMAIYESTATYFHFLLLSGIKYAIRFDKENLFRPQNIHFVTSKIQPLFQHFLGWSLHQYHQYLCDLLRPKIIVRIIRIIKMPISIYTICQSEVAKLSIF